MFRIVFFGALCSVGVLSLGQAEPFPYGSAGVAPVAPLLPSPLTAPFAGPGRLPAIPGRLPARPLLAPGAPGYNNPYYNQYNGGPGANVPILTYTNDRNIDGSYAFSFTTADGKQAQEEGYLRDAYVDNNGEPQGTQVVQGSYAYISPEGTPIQVNYIADENGFRPSGVHIPADGRAAAPLLGERGQALTLDPAFNRQDPYNYRNRYYPGKFNNNLGPYDSRYPYEATKLNSLYNNYNPYRPGPNGLHAKPYKEIA